MANDNVVIIGSLNDKELKSSIDSLVKHVEQGTKTMATSFNNAIEGMKKSLQSLGNASLNMGDTSDGGTSRRTKKNKDEEQSVKTLTASYDQLAVATQNALQPKSAKDSFYVFLQNMREQAAALARELKAMPSSSLDKQFAEYQRFETEILRVKDGIRELRMMLNEAAKKPNHSRLEIKAITDEIGVLENRLKQLTAEQIRSVNRIASEDKAAMAQKQAEYEKQVQEIKALTSEKERANHQTQQQASHEARVTEEIRKQADAIRNSNEWRTTGQALYTYAPSGARTYSAEVISARSALSIEEQILQVQQRIKAEEQARIDAERRNQEEAQKTIELERQQLQVEQQINNEISQRKTYQKPNTAINESFSDMASKKLGGFDDIKMYAKNMDDMASKLKALQDVYRRLNDTERISPFGKQLRDEIQITSRELDKLRKEMGRPINAAALTALPTKTLDDIAYKLRMLQEYRRGLDLSKQSEQVRNVTKEIAALEKKQNEIIGSTRRWANENNAITRSLDYMKNRLAFIFTVGATTNFTKQIYDIRGQYELLERSIGILVDSMQQGSQIFAELNAMAIKSPFTTMELGAAAKQLTAYDIAAKDVVDTTKRLADMAAAVGVPIERLTYALGQIKAYGYLNARDARMFANAGIPLVQELSDRYTALEGRLVSVADIYDRIKKKAISFEDVMDVITEVTDEGGRFFNFQEKAADTLKVKIANLTLAYNNMLNEIGKSHQSLLTMPLTALKSIFENWRNLNNILWSVIITFGVLKLAQVTYLIWGQKVATSMALQTAAGAKLAGILKSIKASYLALAENPFGLALAGIALVSLALTKLIFDYADLTEANRNFNKAVSDNAKENIDSINKFFDEYNKHLDGIGGENAAEQTKMWERIKEEIEKTSKAAQYYVNILEDIPDTSKRIQAGVGVLEQLQKINDEARRFAELDLFNIGGGFANEPLAKDLKDYERSMNVLIKKFGSVSDAAEKFSEKQLSNTDSRWQNYVENLKEVEGELNNFISILDNVNINKVLGDSDDVETQISNIREFTSIVRDNFFATEEGQKITASGRALINKYLDEWIAKQGISNNIINEERANIERNRTAWETFFNQISKKDKERLDYMVSTNKVGSKEFEEIWNNAADNMAESARDSYEIIKDQIADLRRTAPIVIQVVYKETKEALDDQQKQFVHDFIEPENANVLSTDAYFKKRKENVEKFGTLQKKQGEDNVEWEDRLGKQYRENTESIKKLNKQLANKTALTKADREAKEKDLNLLKDQNDALEKIRKQQNFNYEKDSKTHGKQGRKDVDVVAEALKQEISLINEMRGSYDKLRKAGVNNTDAITLASKGYESTLVRINNVLSKYGISKFNAKDFAGKNVHDLLNSLTEQRDTLLASGKVKTSSIKDLEVEIKKLTIDAKTYDMKKIADGLNNELNKLKDEYELAIELDANPELGNMFADLFDINLDELPHTFEDALNRAQTIINDKLKEMKITNPFNLLKTQIQTLGVGENKTTGFAEQVGLGEDSEVIKSLTKWQDTFRKMFKSNLVETEKALDDYVKKYGDYSDKIAEIEHNRLEQINKLNKAYYNEQLRELPEYSRKLNAINNSAMQQRSQAQWDEFKNSRLYITLFENLELASTDALTTMKAKLDEVRGSMKNLKPEQLKQITEQYQKLEKELISRNPFKDVTKHAKDYLKATGKAGKDAQKNFRVAQQEYAQQEGVVIKLKEQYEQKKAQSPLDRESAQKLAEQLNLEELKLKALKAILSSAEQEVEKYNYMVKIFKEQANELADTLQMIGTNLQSLSDLRDNLQETFQFDFGDSLNGAIDGLAKVGGGINNVVSSAQSGNIFGAVNGVVDVFTGLGDGIASLFGDGSARTKRLNREIEKSVEVVRKLELAYSDLEQKANKAFGSMETSARRAQVANKEQQLIELERQMALEKSKRSKDRDDDAIKQYEETIHELRIEITNLKDDIVNNLLGSDIKSAAESFVEAWVSAWKAGEDTLIAVDEKLDEMVQNLIKKAASSAIVDKYLSSLYAAVDEYASSNSLGGVDITTSELQALAVLSKQLGVDIDNALTLFYGNLENLGVITKNIDNNKELSALQQGIQGVTEDTASAIEAYLNIVSQKVFEQNEYLMQIRDVLLSFNLDVQLGTLSQMLLQLQQSYTVQVAIQNILSGALTPNGRAFVVEIS